jgi:hypothetical protein
MKEPTKRTVRAVLVKLLFHKQRDRGMTLLPFRTRCVRAGEVHEIVTTDQRDADGGTRIDRVGFLGFAEVLCAGVVERGDVVRSGGRRIGTVLGFDDCHCPNHLNILLTVDEPVGAADLGLHLEQVLEFVPTEREIPQ